MKTIVAYILYKFLVVQDGKVNSVPSTLLQVETEVSKGTF